MFCVLVIGIMVVIFLKIICIYGSWFVSGSAPSVCFYGVCVFVLWVYVCRLCWLLLCLWVLPCAFMGRKGGHSGGPREECSYDSVYERS